MLLNINTKYILLFKYQTDRISHSTDYMIDMKGGTDYVMISDRLNAWDFWREITILCRVAMD